ncbi:MAG: glutamate racemase [Acidimicrobiales bacterium]
MSETSGRPIGIFDSGFGGLTIVRALIDLVPSEHLSYVGDTGRYPYGSRPAEEVSKFARQIGRFLVEEENAKLVVVACNTAAAVALDELAAELPVPVVGVIEPGMRAAARATRQGHIGVIGTVGTIASGAYQQLAGRLDLGAEVHCAACPGFVEFVERGDTDSDQVHVLAERLLAPLKEVPVDTLLLGCTHYPFLARTLGDVMGRDVVLVSSAEETGFDVVRLIEEQELGRISATGEETEARRRFFSTGDASWFVEMGRLLLGPELSSAERVSFV